MNALREAAGSQVCSPLRHPLFPPERWAQCFPSGRSPSSWLSCWSTDRVPKSESTHAKGGDPTSGPGGAGRAGEPGERAGLAVGAVANPPGPARVNYRSLRHVCDRSLLPERVSSGSTRANSQTHRRRSVPTFPALHPIPLVPCHKKTTPTSKRFERFSPPGHPHTPPCLPRLPSP